MRTKEGTWIFRKYKRCGAIQSMESTTHDHSGSESGYAVSTRSTSRRWEERSSSLKGGLEGCERALCKTAIEKVEGGVRCVADEVGSERRYSTRSQNGQPRICRVNKRKLTNAQALSNAQPMGRRPEEKKEMIQALLSQPMLQQLFPFETRQLAGCVDADNQAFFKV